MGSLQARNWNFKTGKGMKEWNIPNAQLVSFIIILCVVSVKIWPHRTNSWDHQKDVACAYPIIQLLETQDEFSSVSHDTQEGMRQGSQFTFKQQREPSAKSANPVDLNIAHSVLFTASKMPKSQPSCKFNSLHWFGGRRGSADASNSFKYLSVVCSTHLTLQ